MEFLRQRTPPSLFGLALLGAAASCASHAAEPSPSVHRISPVPELPAAAEVCRDSELVDSDHLAEATGTRISLEGMPIMAVACTDKECTDGRACCNWCAGEYVLIDERRQVNLRGLPGCAGMDCDYTCEPFGPKPTRRYRFVGVYDHQGRVLQVERFCASDS